MSENAIILGAGASADAGIPMMSQFMDTMWTLARLGPRYDSKIPKKDLEILVEALKVREELDNYHGRAAFDVWNIEDILSILSFSSGKSLELMTQAIARVIELTCNVIHDGKLNHHTDTISNYANFWRALINWSQEKNASIPPIITFNYDLVLERSLLQALVGKYYRASKPFKYDGVEIAYSAMTCENPKLQCQTGQWRQQDFSQTPGLILQEFAPDTKLEGINLLKFEILKLHGSVNFPQAQNANPSWQASAPKLITALADPLILPPVFNKATDTVGKDIWGRALQVLRNCKNIIICGYSLPATDIYMQYFLKAALGPNQDLNRIFVFDPVLFDDEHRTEGEALRQRYACNFSAPIQRRIEFHPWLPEKFSNKGTMNHLIWLLENHPQNLLFG